MPALILFGRAWRVSSDDFVLPGFIDIVVNTVWLIASWVVFWRSDSQWGHCDGGNDMRLYFIGVLTALHLSFLTSAALVYWSSKGTIMDEKPRQFVPRCLYVRLFLQIFEIGWNILGTYWLFIRRLDCSSVPETSVIVTSYVVCNWILVVLAVTGICIIFDPTGAKKSIVEAKFEEQMKGGNRGIVRDGVPLTELPDTKIMDIWQGRLRRYTLHFFSNSDSDKAAFTEAGKLFGTMFGGEDLTPSDCVAGLKLLALRHHDANGEEDELQEVLPMSRRSLPMVRQPQSFDDFADLYRKDWLHPFMLSHFLKFAKATYSAPLVLVDNQPRAVIRLLKNAVCCRCLPGRKTEFRIIDDDYCFSCCTAGVKEVVQKGAGGEDVKFFHMCYTNKVFRTPFYIAKDTITKTVVVAVRGTMSLHDLITDVVGWPTPFNYPGVPEHFKGHHGMVNCAKELKMLLDEDNMLGNLMAEDPDYKLVFTGTSLGAGVGTMLSMLYQKEYPDVRCYAYSPPGGLLNEEAAEACNNYVISLIYGNDIVSRLSMRSIEKLKLSVIDCLKECELPKYRVLFGGKPKRNKSKSTASKNEITAPLTHPTVARLSQIELLMDDPREKPIASEQLPGEKTPLDTRAEKPSEDTGRRISFANIDIDTDVASPWKLNNNRASFDLTRLTIPVGDMWPPGKILYITQTPEFKNGRLRSARQNTVRWRWRWATRKEFSEIIMNPRIISDHVPFRMEKAVRVLARNQTRFGPLPIGED